MFVQKISPSVLFLGLSCVRMQNVIPWIKKVHPEVKEIRFYVAMFAWESSLSHIRDDTLKISFHDIPMVVTKEDHGSLVQRLESEFREYSIPIVCIIQDPM